MFATSFPDLRWLKEQTENRFYRQGAAKLLPSRAHARSVAGTGWPTVVLNVRTSNIYRDNILGPLSLFSNFSGRSRVSVEGRAIDVPAECFLVTNEHQRYTLEVGDTKAETFNIHFGDDWTQGAMSSLTSGHTELIDNPGSRSPYHFRNKLIEKSPAITQSLRALQSHACGDPMRRDEILYGLLRHLLEQFQVDLRLECAVPAVKASTRQEIIRRLALATDAIYSSGDRSLDLDQLARISMLSKFHLLRAFKEVFRKTPYQFMTDVKIARARIMLQDPQMEITEISRVLGFDSPSTFSRRFRNVTGQYPSRFRERN
jgi:AraC family transcriptional regulator